MSIGIFTLVMIAAVFHASWNVLARRVSGNLAVFWLSLWVAVVVWLPVVSGLGVLRGPQALWHMVATGYPYMLATGALHAVYFFLLAQAYEHGEISVVYPVARGSGIGLTAVGAWAFLAEEITLLGAAGIALVSLGILSMGFVAVRSAQSLQGFRAALGVGATIVSYSLVDKLGVAVVNPILYIWSMFALTALMLIPTLRRRHTGMIGQVWQTSWRSIVLIGIGSSGTYLIILFALTLGQVSYIVALRELAVVIGALFGVVFLREPLTRVKLIAIVVITAGLVCIKFAP